MEDKFNINISEIRQGDVAGFAQKLIKSGSDDFDVMFPTLTGAGSMIQQGYLLDLHTVPYLDFGKPWWNKTANDSLTSGHKLYAGIGNITTMTNDATWVCLFNKEMVRDLGLPDHYQIVKDGKWTIDILHENAKKATKDLNGDGELTPEDQWGAIGQYESSYCLFAASGQFIVEKDENDYPALVLNSDRSVYAMDKVIDLMTDKTAYINADDYTGKYENVWIDITTNVFAESRCLYLICNIEIVKNLRGMETNFGILPLPKTDGLQEKYYNTMQYGNASCVALPVTALNLERTGAIVEAWAAESVDTLTKAYYDINLKGKNARDDESEEMLDLIFSTRVIDQGMFFNWAGLYDFFNNFVKTKSVDFASAYEKQEPKWITAIEKTIAAIEENN
ncbi:MAG: extracellular solute-binding protein [Oscillospiraceae bacterium]|nr:extracellular solute-binding protein [Oscillospiraceae bacterium]